VININPVNKISTPFWGYKPIGILFLLLLLTPLLSTSCFATGLLKPTPRSQIIFRAGLLKLNVPVSVYSTNFETGQIIQSQSADMIEETSDIKFKLGHTFGVSMSNIRHKLRLRFSWRYPSTQNSYGRNKFSTYTSPEYAVIDSHQVFWQLNKGERKGKYQLSIFFNGRLAKTEMFNVY